MVPVRPVHEPWVELDADNDVQWQPSGRDTYEGSEGGGSAGPSSAMMQVVRTADSLTSLFLFILPLSFFQEVAKLSNKYAYLDWVVEKWGKNRDGDTKKRSHFEDVPAKQGSKAYPGGRHRADKEKKKYKITPGFVLCWIAILILQGAHFGQDKGNAGKMWRGAPRGISFPYIRNAMTRDAYVFMRQYIHFCDNSKRKSSDQRGYDPLFKVSFAMKTMMLGMRKAWSAGKNVTINESAA